MASPDLTGIDLQFRPDSYFWPTSLSTHTFARVKGAERRADLKGLIASDQLDEIPEFLTQSSLSSPGRTLIGRLHPRFLGGEYLDDLEKSEVMIARITIKSTTRDVVCVYARQTNTRVRYRVVDEYGGSTLSGRTTRTSIRPLTLGQLEAFFNGAWSILEVLDANYGDEGYPLERMLNFVEGVESEFYPDIESLYVRRIKAWAARQVSFSG